MGTRLISDGKTSVWKSGDLFWLINIKAVPDRNSGKA